MSGPGSPGQEGPTFAPPQLPPGWIAQWDANSKKYYFVQLSTGVSQWEVPTDSAPIGGTPAAATEHPYGVPGQPQLITHPDGTQTVKHPDGTLEPVMPDESGRARGIAGDGPTGDRGLGSMAMNALLGGGKQSGSGSGHNSSSSPFGGLAGQVLSGLTHQSSGQQQQQQQQQQQHSSSSGGLGGKLVGQLASNLFSSGGKQSSQQQGYHGGQSAQGHGSGGMMGGVAHMFGGQSASSNQNFGYSNQGHQGGYSAPAPPSTYQPSGALHSQQHNQSPAIQQHHTPPAHGGYQSQQPQHHAPYGQSPSHQPSTHSQYGQSPSHQPPPQYGHSPSHQQHQYGQPPLGYGGGGGGGQGGYGHQHSSPNQAPPGYGGGGGGGGFNPSYMPPPPPGQYPGAQSSYQPQGPHVPHGSHPYGSNPAY